MQCLKQSYTENNFYFSQVTVPDRCSLLTPRCYTLALVSFSSIKKWNQWLCEMQHVKQKIAKMNVSMYASTFDFLEKQFCSIFGMSFCCLFFPSPCLLLSLSLPSEGCLLAPVIAVALKLIGFQRRDDNSICRFYFLVWFCCSAEMDENLISEDENSIFD